MSSRKRKKRDKQRAEESAELQGGEPAAEDSAAADSDDGAEDTAEGEADEAALAAADGGEVDDAEPAPPMVSDITELKPRRQRTRKGAEEPASEPEPEPKELADAESELSEDAEAEEDEDDEAFGDQAAKEAPKTRAQLKRVLESLIFVSDQVITAQQLGRIAKTKVAEVREALAEISVDYEGRGIELVEVNGGYQFRSAAASGPYVRALVAQRPVRLTRAQLETLALIAYRQPITRPEVDDVRGVDSGSAIKVLLERELIKILGRKEEAGRPLLYGTTPFFLEFFGMNTMQELPTLREFTELSDEHQELFKRKTNEIGDLSAEAEMPASVSGAQGYVDVDASGDSWDEEPDGDAGVVAQDSNETEGGTEAEGRIETSEREDAADEPRADDVDASEPAAWDETDDSSRD